MEFQNKTFLALLILSGIIILFVMLKSKSFFRSLVFSMCGGLGSLLAVNMLSSATGIVIGINPVTALISALGGIPGVIALLAGRVMLT